MAKRANKPGESGEDVIEERADDAAPAQAPAVDAAAAPPQGGAANETAAAVEPHAPATLEQLQAQIAALQAKADEHWDRLLRTQAEMENLRKRSRRDVENAHKFALEGFASDLLGVKDSLEMGLNAASQDDAGASGIREGTELTLKLLTQTLEKHDIQEINPLGEKFDPELHQAMNVLEDQNAAPNTVVMVIQKGYLLNGRLLRPALVSVAK